MLLNINAITYESQLSNYLTVGIDQGSNLWVMTIVDRSTGKYSRHSFKGLNKEADCYKQIAETVKVAPQYLFVTRLTQWFYPSENFN